MLNRASACERTTSRTQRLPSGFERLMKCYIAVVRKGRDGTYPDQAALKSLRGPLARTKPMGEIRKKMERPKQALAAVATYHYYA